MAPAHSASYTGGLKVIGTGLGRTGTSSLKLALERLYGAKCYHMTEVIENGGPFGWFDFWTDVSAVRKPVGALLKRGTQYTDECTGKLTTSPSVLPGQGHHGAATSTHGRLRKHHRLPGALYLYLRPSPAITPEKNPPDSGVFSVTFQACMYWKQLLEAYPDAKLVHSTRSPESWAKSVMDTVFRIQPDNAQRSLGVRLIHALFPFKVGRPMARMLRSVVSPQTNGDFTPDGLVKKFKEWEASVIAEAPKGKLLVFKAEQGWEPLCKFLGVPVPDEPFPHVNDTKEMQKIIAAITAAGWITAAMYVAAIAWAAGKVMPLLR